MKLQIQNDFIMLSLKGDNTEFTYEQIKDCLFNLNGKEGYIRCTGQGTSYGHGYSLPNYHYKFITTDFELLSLSHLDTVINLEPDKIAPPILIKELPTYIQNCILAVNGEEGSFKYKL